MRYYYEEDNSIYYDEYYIDTIKKYKLNSLSSFYKLFGKDGNSIFLKKEEDEISSLTDYNFTFETKQVTVEVDPIINKYSNDIVKRK